MTLTPWLDLAKAEIGTHEAAGTNDNPRVMAYYRDAAARSTLAGSERLIQRPALTKALSNCISVPSEAVRGFRCSHRFAIEHNKAVRPLVAVLARTFCPYAIVGTIRSIVVATLKRMPIWAGAHVGVKCPKVCPPRVTNGDASAAVILKVGPGRVMAPPPHVHPYAVLHRAFHSVLCARDLMGREHISHSSAPATPGAARPYIAVKHDARVPAYANIMRSLSVNLGNLGPISRVLCHRDKMPWKAVNVKGACA